MASLSRPKRRMRLATPWNPPWPRSCANPISPKSWQKPVSPTLREPRHSRRGWTRTLPNGCHVSRKPTSIQIDLCMNTTKLLLIGPLPRGLEQRLGQRYDLHPLWTEPDRARFLENSKGRFAGGVTMSRHGCPADIFSLLQGTVVACFGVGYEGLDLEAAKRHDVQVSTTPNVLNDCVADCAFALVLSVARRIVAADRFVQK